MMKRVFALLCACVIALSSVMHAFAADGNVTYSGNSGKFIFAPGSEYSPTDLFPNFKDVMPGDSITQKITVHNKASNKVKVKIYLRALGAHEDSEEFLSQLKLRVRKSGDNTMAYMFDAAADETAQLTDWVCIGTLYSGGECELVVTLDVPVTMGNEYANAVGYLDWEFGVSEYPVEDSDPKPPQTGDDAQLWLWIGMAAVSLLVLLLLVLVWKKGNKKKR
jgi:LPXTG-motif cell wall-anchored protein